MGIGNKRSIIFSLLFILAVIIVTVIIYPISLSHSDIDELDKEYTSTEDKISHIMDKMTLEEKVGQMLFVAFRSEDDYYLNDNIKNVIDGCKVGGVILFGENIKDRQQLTELTAALKEQTEIPLFIGIDEEGGIVSRIGKSGIIQDYNIPSAQEMAENSTVEENYTLIGNTLKDLGINTDFAPVADVNSNPDNPVIGDRAFSSDPEKCGEAVAKAVNSLESCGVLSCLKHFPGHGDTVTDSHKGETYIYLDKEQISQQLVPFEKGIEAGADFIMAAHIKVPALSDKDLPASLNEDILGLIDREKFKGVVITDAMDMGAVSNYFTPEEAAMQAVKAGVDMILMPEDTAQAYNSIIQAVKNGEISEERINSSVYRILTIKEKIGG